MESKRINTKVITGPDTRWAYVNAWEPKAMYHGGKPKFSVRLIIPKTDEKTVENIRAAIKAAYDESIDRLRYSDGTLPALDDIFSPLLDGDAPGLRNAQDYAGCWYINANSDYPPGIVDKNKVPITRHSEVYSGVYGRASITFYAFNGGTRRGIACHLSNLQKVRDGESLGHNIPACDDFKEE